MVKLVEGRLHLQFSCNMITMDTAATVGVVNDGEWHTIEVEVYNTTAFLLVDSNERVNATSEKLSSIFEPSSERFYIGGLPPDLQTAIGWLEITRMCIILSLPLSLLLCSLPLSFSPLSLPTFAFSLSPSLPLSSLPLFLSHSPLLLPPYFSALPLPPFLSVRRCLWLGVYDIYTSEEKPSLLIPPSLLLVCHSEAVHPQ